MTKRLIKTAKDHRRMRATLTENTVTLTTLPAAGALTAGVVNVAYAGAVTFSISNGIGASHFSVSSGALPVGMSLNARTGVLSGTPTVVGANSFSIRSTDDFGNTLTKAYTLAIAAS